MAEGLTRLDVRLLDELQRDATLSTQELADRIGSSQSSCWRRMQRLKDEGYIKGQVVLLDEARLQPGLHVYLRVAVSFGGKQDREALLRLVELTPEILECYWTFGEMDMMIKLLAPDMAWFRKFITRLRDMDGVRGSDSIMTMAEVKRTTAIPVREG